MTGQILYVTDGEQLHKCYLTNGLARELTIGDSLEETITIPSLLQQVKVNWDGESCRIGNEQLKVQ